MKEFGYFKIASLFYFIMMILGMVIKTNTIILSSVFFVILIGVFYVFQKFLYTTDRLKAPTYEDMLLKTSLKELFMISLYFVLLSAIINGVLALAFYIISKNNLFSQLIDINTSIISFLLVFVALIISNYLYYKLSYKKEYLIDNGSDYKFKTHNQKPVVTSEDNDVENNGDSQEDNSNNPK